LATTNPPCSAVSLR